MHERDAETIPSDPERLRRDANARAAARDWRGAADAFAALAAVAPDDAAAWIGLARAAEFAGQPRRSHAAALAAAAADPPTWPHGLALARLLRGWHEVPALRALAARLSVWRTQAPVADLVELADLLGQEDAHADALDWLDVAIARDPPSAPASYLRGTTRLFLGDMAAARADLEQAIALAPHFAHAHWRLSELRAGDTAGASTRIARMSSERERAAPESEHAVHLDYALHAELHDTGDYAAAWGALERGMSGKRAMLRHDPEVDRALFAAIRAAFPAASGDHAPDGGYDDAPVPLFIIGLFRSGTTVLERLLAGHPELADGGESAAFLARLRLATDVAGPLSPALLARTATVDWNALGADFLASQRWRARGRRVWTEKLPANFLLAGAIARALPQARFVHMRRAPMDVCFSNLRTLYGPIAAYSYDQTEMAAYHREYESLMAHWRGVLGDRLLEIDHAELVADPEPPLRRVLAHAGLAWDPRVLTLVGRGGAVSTASAAQIRDGLRRDTTPAWWPYRERLRPLAVALGVDI